MAESAGRDQGASFAVELPLLTASKTAEPADENGSGQASSALPTRSRRRVLLVEDHKPTRIALAHVLGRRDYEVLLAGNVAEARTLAQKGGIGLLISDIGLPDGNGYDLMNELRERYGISGIALTGYGMEHDMARSRAAGFVSHLIKPVHVQALDKALAATMAAGAPSGQG